MDQLDKKKKVVLEQQSKGEKLAQDPKAPKFLNSYMDRLKALWTDANKQAETRLAALKGNSSLIGKLYYSGRRLICRITLSRAQTDPINPLIPISEITRYLH